MCRKRSEAREDELREPISHTGRSKDIAQFLPVVRPVIGV